MEVLRLLKQSTVTLVKPRGARINLDYTECPTHYRTRHFFNNFTTNEDIATKFEVDLPHCVRKVTTS